MSRRSPLSSGATPPSVLVTGGSSGIGHAASHALAQRGWRVFTTARREEDLARLQAEGLEALPLELASSESIESCITQVLERTGGRLDALFNNAAYGQPGAVEDLSREVLRAQLEANLLGTHELTTRIIPVMREQGSGRIVQNSSVLGFAALPYRGAYVCSKFALEGLTDTLRQELHGSGIHVSLIEPGPIASRFRENAYRAFKANIDADHSYHRDTYRAVEARLAGRKGSSGGAFTLGPAAVVDKLIHALESRRPKPRYHVTLPTHLFGVLKRLLTTRGMDRVLLASTRDERRT
ncbi:MAG: SDR family NAD(P)-dependent oxidoreductase [Halomonas sp.]|jgi:NAD(P)-dependent dehydrogenase (short-subunit alcohol dehydrogenase family)|uniref:SDR family NAD(P)-dependent oxidoreductase n=1 Tax=Billgrantia tianxiuensis TaxID=2497861 RepID=A0A6I6SGX7_9GAMM|nr:MULTISPECIES: SDR family NAD(P)-dependent oxidoreductase [Halomonas]MCE8032246.1 SDR family NAD(P)-dependent oxidoreductase [Halomonas sp. MCCC 1A11057]MDX5434517.1 SDR family NAD(P)-dependent oxidoreductase [Halomonas sp.]QHC49749.1 SDR family NAD(P)-dependent oxidoreductase [Halomonas tianxiuensis]